MMLARFVTGAIALVVASGAVAQTKKEMLGNFLVQSEEDRFTNEPTVLGIAFGQGGALGLKCSNKELSLFLMDPKSEHDFEKGEVYEIKQRVDKNAVEDVKGVSIDGRMLQLLLPPELLTQMATAKEIAYRVDMGVKRADIVVPLKQAHLVVGRIKKACGVN